MSCAFLSSVHWHFAFKTASLCEWAKPVGCLFFKPALPQPVTSRSCNAPAKEFDLTSQKKVKAVLENDIFWLCFRVCRNREREWVSYDFWPMACIFVESLSFSSGNSACNTVFPCNGCGIQGSMAGLFIVNSCHSFLKFTTFYLGVIQENIGSREKRLFHIPCACDN